ncbi:MAG: hypothetical protein P9L94_14230 [Candidatus Hinthialibacter antarcticus]|nr:hypothetical protein [Candidatus Hinthialibacter antarcticus]
MLISRDKRNAVRNDDNHGAKQEPTARYNDGNQNTVRFQRYLENRGCPIRLASPKSDDIRWLG